MIILISGATHTGKTVLAQKLLEKYKYPYLSIDHLKMGLIRSHNTHLTPMSSDEELTGYLWPILREMIKTAIENKQNLVVEGCYIPFDWEKSFDEAYLEQIRYYCLVLSENYIKNHYEDIMAHANDVESRLDDSYCTTESLICENAKIQSECEKYGLTYILIDDKYDINICLEKE